MPGAVTTVTDPAARAAGRGAVTGGWKYSTYGDPTPPQSLPVSPAHLRGSLPPGRAPIKARPANVPIVVVDSTDEWAGWGSGAIPGWQRLGDTVTDDHPGYVDDPAQPPGIPTRGSPAAASPHLPPARVVTGLGFDAHDAYRVSSGVSIEVAETEGNHWRGVDVGAVAGRTRPLDDATHDDNTTTTTRYAMAGHNPSNAVRRGSNGLALNNPEGIPGHDTARVQRWQNTAIRFGNPLRTHFGHALRQRTPWAHTPTTISPRDPYGSPFDAGWVMVNTGTVVPERQAIPGMWDQVALDMPLDAGVPSLDDLGFYGGDFGGDYG